MTRSTAKSFPQGSRRFAGAGSDFGVPARARRRQRASEGGSAALAERLFGPEPDRLPGHWHCAHAMGTNCSFPGCTGARWFHPINEAGE